MVPDRLLAHSLGARMRVEVFIRVNSSIPLLICMVVKQYRTSKQVASSRSSDHSGAVNDCIWILRRLSGLKCILKEAVGREYGVMA